MKEFFKILGLVSSIVGALLMGWLLLIYALSIYIHKGPTDRYKKKSEIEEVMGLEFPDYYENSRYLIGERVSFNGDYSVNVSIKFKESANLTKLYEDIDRKVKEFENVKYSDDSDYVEYWTRYSYSTIRPSTDFSIHINPSDSTAFITYGTW